MVIPHRRRAQHSRCMRVTPWVGHGSPRPEVVFAAALARRSHAIASGWTLQLFRRFRGPTEGSRQLLRWRWRGGPSLPGAIALIGKSTLYSGRPAEGLRRGWIDGGQRKRCSNELRPRAPLRLEG
jgi:hypothetical protein